MAAKFKYRRSDKDGQWRFNLVAANGEVVATSEGYTSKEGCLNGVEAVKKAAAEATTEEEPGA